MSRTEANAIDQITQALTRAHLDFDLGPSIAGLQPDLLVHGSEGQRIVVDVKSWDPRGGNTARAGEQSNYIKNVTGVDQAFVVLPSLGKSFGNLGAVNVKGLMPAIHRVLQRPPAKRGAGRAGGAGKASVTRAVAPDDRIVFAAMPFKRRYNDTFFVGMRDAAEKAGVTCKRTDQEDFSGDIVAEIKRLIEESAAVFVDLSECRPNVLYEAGYAHALNKPAIHLSCTPNEVPFDVSTWNLIPYELGNVSAIKRTLVRRLKAVL